MYSGCRARLSHQLCRHVRPDESSEQGVGRARGQRGGGGQQLSQPMRVTLWENACSGQVSGHLRCQAGARSGLAWKAEGRMVSW